MGDRTNITEWKNIVCIHVDEQHLYQAIAENKIIQRYQGILSVDFLDLLQFREKFNQFSWGILYVRIKRFRKEIITNEMQLFKEALNIELLMLAVELLDGICDEDINIGLSHANLVLLVSELICSSLHVIMNIEGYDIVHKYVM